MAETTGAPPKKFKILVCAEGCAWGMGPALVDAFSELGHDAELFDWTKFLYTSRGGGLGNRILDRLLFRRVAGRINEALARFVQDKKYDLVLVTKGLHLYPATISEIKERSVRTANWNPDDFFNPVNSSAGLRASFGVYDCIYTPRRHLIPEYLSRGARRCEYIDWYFVPRYFHPSADRAASPGYDNDVVFIGSWSRRREALLGHLKDFDLKVFGGSWKWASAEFKRRVRCLPPVYNDDMCRLIERSRINLNIITRENRDTSNLRNFEIPACGGFQLSERSEEILRLFEEGKEIACFGDGAELASKCAYYLSDEKARAEIAASGYKKLLSGKNTALDRARQILETVFL